MGAAAGITAAGQGEQLDVLLDTVTVKARAGDTDGAFELYEIDGPEGSGPPPHAHPWTEAFYVLDGEIEITIGERTENVAAGVFVMIPAGTIHTFTITSPRTRFLGVSSGSGAVDFFTDLSKSVGRAASDAESLPEIVTVAKRNGLTSPLFS